MEIAIYGAGSMGTVLGAFLSKAGVAADLISHNAAHINALKKNGAKIGGTVSFSTPPFDGSGGRGRALLPAEMEKKYDVIFLLTKQMDNAATAEKLRNSLTASGVICTMQNGLPEPLLAGILGEEKVLGCICVWGAGMAGPGAADLTSTAANMRFSLGSSGGGPHPMIAGIKEILEKISPVGVEQNFTGVRWSKLLINAAFSGMSAVSGLSFGEIAADKKAGNCALQVIRECIEVCARAGITIEPVQGKFPAEFMYFRNPLKKFMLSRIMRFAMRHYGGIKSGMLNDIDRGKPCEIDSINGVVCQMGKKYNVPTPCNDRIVETVHAIERGEKPYRRENLDLFEPFSRPLWC